MPAPTTVRRAKQGEIDALCQLMRKGYERYDVQGTIYESPRFDAYLAERFQHGDLFFVIDDASLAGSPIGFAHVLEQETAVHVNHLVLKRGVRGRGHGNLLLRAVMAYAAQAELPVTLDVNARNVGATRFYERAGFRMVRKTPVAMIPRRSGPFPAHLVQGRDDYARYGFCYVDLSLSWDTVKVGIVDDRIVRLPASSLSDDFVWDEFLDWAKWANVYVYDKLDSRSMMNVKEKWFVLRMAH